MATSPEEAGAAMIANLAAKTGKDLAGWLAIAAASGAAKHGQLMAHLKADHGLTHGYANLVAHKHFAALQPPPEDPVAVQYAGAKAGLKPVYDALMAVVQGFGDDVEVAPKKAYVSLRRSKQFALFQPSTAKRLDVGLKLSRAPEGRLEASGSFSAMCSHRVRLAGPDEVDAELIAWLREAYDNA